MKVSVLAVMAALASAQVGAQSEPPPAKNGMAPLIQAVPVSAGAASAPGLVGGSSKSFEKKFNPTSARDAAAKQGLLVSAAANPSRPASAAAAR